MIALGNIVFGENSFVFGVKRICLFGYICFGLGVSAFFGHAYVV